MSLQNLWFVLIAVVWTVFFVLEGFDFGVGMLHRVLGRTETERRVVVNTIGPWWDGNEVWLIVGGAGIFAAFPGWYATWFSAGYLALLLVLVALIVRGLSFEYRGKVDNPRWRSAWSWALTFGSLFAPLLLGVALGDLLAGLPIGADQEFTGNFWDLLTPYGLLFGVTLTVLCVLHGATFVTIRTTDALRERAHRIVVVVHPVAVVLLVVLGFATLHEGDRGWARALVLPIAAAIAALLAGFFARARQDARAFAATTVAIAATLATLFVNLFADVMVSSTTPANNLTVANTASGHYALQVMTWVVVIFLPLVIVYQGWSFVVFRRRLSHDEPAPASK